MPARTAVGLTGNAAPPVVAQRLDVDPDSLGNLPGAEHAAHDPVPTRDVARAVKAASTVLMLGRGADVESDRAVVDGQVEIEERAAAGLVHRQGRRASGDIAVGPQVEPSPRL